MSNNTNTEELPAVIEAEGGIIEPESGNVDETGGNPSEFFDTPDELTSGSALFDEEVAAEDEGEPGPEGESEDDPEGEPGPEGESEDDPEGVPEGDSPPGEEGDGDADASTTLTEDQSVLLDTLQAIETTPSEAMALISTARGIQNQLATPETASELIASLIAACIDEFGEEFEPPTEDYANILRTAPENLTQVERALLQSNRMLKKQMDAVLNEAKQNAKEVIHAKSSATYIAAIKAVFPGADVQSHEIVSFMSQNGITDPVVAYKIMKHDDIVKAEAAKAFERGKKASTAPKAPGVGSQAKTYDPSKVSNSEERRLLSLGYQPAGKAKSPFDQ